MKNKKLKFLMLFLVGFSMFQPFKLDSAYSFFSGALRIVEENIKKHPYWSGALGLGIAGLIAARFMGWPMICPNNKVGTPTNPTDNKKIPFVTHCMAIITDDSEKYKEGSFSIHHVPLLFSEAELPIIISSDLLHENFRYGLDDKFDYFDLSSQGENNPKKTAKTSQYILCIPKKQLPNNYSSTKQPDVLTEDELKIGIPFLQLKRITTHKDLIRKENSANSASTVIPRAFIPATRYPNGKQAPRWALVFMGHGEQYHKTAVYNDIPDTLFDYPGAAAGIAAETLSTVLLDLNKKINLELIHMNTCYGGGIIMAYVLKAMQGCNVIVTTGTIHGDATTNGAAQSYKKFYEIIKKPLLDTNKKDYTDIYNQLAYANAEIRPTKDSDSSPRANNIPAIKPIDKDYFVEFAELINDPKAPFNFTFRIDKKVLNSMQTDKITVPDDKSHVLLYVNAIAKQLHLKNGQSLLSAIPGDTFHIIDELVCEEACPISDYANKLLCMEGLRATKLFHIKKTSQLRLNNNNQSTKSSYSIRLIYNYEQSMYAAHPEACLTILVTDLQSKQNYRCTFDKLPIAYARQKNYLNIIKLVPIQEQEAAETIKYFDEKQIYLEKLANKQHEYRPIKHADIKMLPLQ